MITFSGGAAIGKSTFARNNSFSTMLDMIISSSLFGSVDDFGKHTDTAISYKSNGLIPITWFKRGFTELDQGLRGEEQIFLYSGYQHDRSVSIDNDVFNVLNMSDVDQNIVNRFNNIYKNIISELDVSKNNNSLMNDKGVSVNYKSPTLRFNDEFYRNYGLDELFYLKFGDVYIPVHDENSDFTDAVDHSSPVMMLLRMVKSPKFENQDQKSYYDCGVDIIGFGFIKIKPSTNDLFVCWALRHDLFDKSVEFSGFPYINIAEDGPANARGYKYNRNVTNFRFKLTFSKEENGKLVQPMTSNFINSRYGSGRTVVKGQNLDIYNRHSKRFIAQDNEYELRLMSTNFRGNLFALKTNRCYLDSIIDIVYSGNESALPGGISKDLIFQLVATQLRECIGIYSPLDISGDRDPLTSLVTDAHMCGSLLMFKKINEKYFSSAAITTRNGRNRSILYYLARDGQVYGNKLEASRHMKDGKPYFKLNKSSSYNMYSKQHEVSKEIKNQKIISGSVMKADKVLNEMIKSSDQAPSRTRSW